MSISTACINGFSNITPNMFVVINSKGEFLTVNNVFECTISGVQIFYTIEDTLDKCIFSDETVLRISVTLSTCIFPV